MWDFPLTPPQASSFAFEVDALYYLIWILSIFFTIVVAAVVTWFAYRYRRGAKADRSNPVHHDNRIEMAWSIPPLILGLAVFVWAAKMYADIYHIPKDAMDVYVIGKQWMWHAQHTNGVRENNELHVPLGKPVRITLTSQDVIHSYYIPAFRVKRDAVPGRYNTMWFKPTKLGKYHLFCAEYCGTEHSLMIGTVTVMDPADFQEWLDRGGAEGKTPTSLADAGKALWDELACGGCHGANSTVRGPSLIGIAGTMRKLKDGQTAEADDNYLRESILSPNRRLTDGYEPLMADYQDQLTEEQVLKLIAYMKSLTPPAKSETAQGGQPARTAGQPGQALTEGSAQAAVQTGSQP